MPCLSDPLTLLVVVTRKYDSDPDELSIPTEATRTLGDIVHNQPSLRDTHGHLQITSPGITWDTKAIDLKV